jgi:hypothetical protein
VLVCIGRATDTIPPTLSGELQAGAIALITVYPWSHVRIDGNNMIGNSIESGASMRTPWPHDLPSTFDRCALQLHGAALAIETKLPSDYQYHHVPSSSLHDNVVEMNFNRFEANEIVCDCTKLWAHVSNFSTISNQDTGTAHECVAIPFVIPSVLVLVWG